MDVNAEIKRGDPAKARIFRERVEAFLNRVESWLKTTSLHTERKPIEIHEEAYGTYEAPSLGISASDGKQLATLIPKGAAVIGAEGRIDLVGAVEEEGLVYFGEGGPRITVTIGSGTEAKRTSHPVFRAVQHEGWYWLDNVRMGYARPLDETLFKDLLKRVTDLYEF